LMSLPLCQIFSEGFSGMSAAPYEVHKPYGEWMRTGNYSRTIFPDLRKFVMNLYAWEAETHHKDSKTQRFFVILYRVPGYG
jgi:hypothetical protein